MRVNRGFTLVELLAILFILGVITAVSVPNIMDTNKKSLEKEIVQYKKTVENAAEVYVETHLDLDEVINLKNNGTDLCIPISNLIVGEDGSAGLLRRNLVNPSNNKKVTELNSSVLAKKNGDVISYTYRDVNC